MTFILKMPSKRRLVSGTRSTPFCMVISITGVQTSSGAKLADWNIMVPDNYSKTELKSLYLVTREEDRYSHCV